VVSDSFVRVHQLKCAAHIIRHKPDFTVFVRCGADFLVAEAEYS
jgi:predicted component of viral defense system (DUF524 family)